MTILSCLLAALSLSLDAFALSLCIGACRAKVSTAAVFRVGLACGGFQLLMPLLGWGLGSRFLDVVSHLGPWIASGLLVFVGGRMIVEACKDAQDCCSRDLTRGWPLISVAVATSIDAMALGIGFAVLGESVTLLAVASGVITLILCIVGMSAGNRLGAFMGKYAQIGGGVVLCLLGVNILRDSFF